MTGPGRGSGRIPRKPHVWIYTTEYVRLTHARNACIVCDQPKDNADRKCPGPGTAAK